MSRGDHFTFSSNFFNLNLQNNSNCNYFQGPSLPSQNFLPFPQLTKLNNFQINPIQQMQALQQINNFQINQQKQIQAITQINNIAITTNAPQIPQSIENLPPEEEDDYSGLSYKNSSKNTKEPVNPQTKKNRCSTLDFRTKWKTEICHFWELNGYCQFGENVKYFQ